MHIIKQLLESNNIDEQVALIETLNQSMFDAKVLTALARYLRECCIKVPDVVPNAVDIVGTGGDGMNTLNFSTLAAILANKAGVPISKHGNKGTTSRCGSFDLLMRMNVTVAQTPQRATCCFRDHGIVFLFAPYFHPVLAKVTQARQVFKARGEKTIFNVIGPLINPSLNRRIIAGVYTPKLVEPYAQALLELGFTHAYVFYGDGLDELSLTGKTHYAQLHQGVVDYGIITPDELGLPACEVMQLFGGSAQDNYREAKLLLNNQLPGPKTDMVIANAAAALRVWSDFSYDWPQAVAKMQRVLRGDNNE